VEEGVSARGCEWCDDVLQHGDSFVITDMVDSLHRCAALVTAEGTLLGRAEIKATSAAADGRDAPLPALPLLKTLDVSFNGCVQLQLIDLRDASTGSSSCLAAAPVAAKCV